MYRSLSYTVQLFNSVLGDVNLCFILLAGFSHSEVHRQSRDPELDSTVKKSGLGLFQLQRAKADVNLLVPRLLDLRSPWWTTE